MKKIIFLIAIIFFSCTQQKHEAAKHIGGALPDIENNDIPLIISAKPNESSEVIPGMYEKGRPAPDVTPPTVAITSPVNGETVSGTVSINVSASDNRGVASVSVYINDVLLTTKTISPYTFSWNTTGQPNGTYIIKAIAFDARGNNSTSTITVAINTTIIIVPPPPVSTTEVSLITPTPADQDGEGSCMSMAVGYSARSIEQYYRTGAIYYSFSTNVFSPEFLYNQIKANADCNSGSNIQVALDFIVANGICTWASLPYSSTDGCDALKITAWQKTEALNYKISTYSKIYNTDRNAIKAMIEQKHPLMVAILADNSFINASTGFVWKTYSGSGNLPHGVVIVGYDDSKNAYKVMNSWGTSWGDGGFSWIDYDFFPTRTGTWCYVIN